jgi:hypothetical protein
VTGRTANRVQDQPVSAAAVGRLAGPDGLTEHASSFTGPEVLVAVGAGLAGAGRTELEALADRGWPSGRSGGRRPGPGGAPLVHPDLLAVEQLGAAATGRTGDHPAVVSHAAVREALAAHPTAGVDQQAMVRDLCQGGHGVAAVVGRAGTGKTFALGMTRHAWQLAGSWPRPRPGSRP